MHQNLRPPIVVEKSGESLKFLNGKYSKVEITPQVVEAFVRIFVLAGHEAKSPNESLEKISYFTTPGLLKKMKTAAKSRSAKIKNIVSHVSGLEVSVDEESIRAKFYKVMVLEGVPLVMKKSLLLQIEQGERTFHNQIGLYVNGIIEESV